MVKTAEQKVRDRYAEQLKQGIEPRPLNDVNQAILAEVRAEVHRAKRKIQEGVDQGVDTIKRATIESVREIAEAKAQALLTLPERSSDSNSSQTVVEAPMPPLTEEPGAAPISSQSNANIVAVRMPESNVPLSGEAWRNMCEAKNQEYIRRCKAEGAWLDAAEGERERLAPDVARHFRSTYDRLAVQHSWPALSEGAALPGQIASYVELCFCDDTRFRAALGALGTLDYRSVHSGDAVTRMVTALRMEWAEYALQFAMSMQTAKAEQDEGLALACRAENRQERKNRRAANDRAREEIMPAARKCKECADADFILGGLCTKHDQELQQITARLIKENVQRDGVTMESSDSE